MFFACATHRAKKSVVLPLLYAFAHPCGDPRREVVDDVSLTRGQRLLRRGSTVVIGDVRLEAVLGEKAALHGAVHVRVIGAAHADEPNLDWDLRGWLCLSFGRRLGGLRGLGSSGWFGRLGRLSRRTRRRARHEQAQSAYQ
jgi:hypothetical protein